ncbi:hypothetical protein [Aquimarina sp. 2201CG14-23]|uniref:hypothetical protein n=1 Tax=Aquimarina mycalae TaxID=3040073 RepID=UPI00247800C5|nr:hypothetical protein [Aquimarina sp. 2201CG14-23]MDH7448436.1 hypothetical protein [Aquimarina sp. 2201CG14-23]
MKHLSKLKSVRLLSKNEQVSIQGGKKIAGVSVYCNDGWGISFGVNTGHAYNPQTLCATHDGFSHQVAEYYE